MHSTLRDNDALCFMYEYAVPNRYSEDPQLGSWGKLLTVCWPLHWVR